jgi:hypothetical protein
MSFLITGQPRSRTAWFAVVTGALHEPISREGWPAFRTEWLANPDMGVSDAGAGMHLTDILAEVAPQTLIIERPQPEVILSMQRYAKGVRLDVSAMERALTDLGHALHRREVLDSPLVMQVPYAALGDPRTLRRCMDHLGVDPPNLEQSMHMNIQSSLSYNLRLLAAKAEHQSDLAPFSLTA